MPMADPTIACVLRSGGIYDERWVDRLRAGVERHITRPYRFVCLTDLEPDCETIALERAWQGWWSKIELFRPGLFEGQVIYLDLDVIVVGDLGEIVSHPHKFTMAQDYYRRHWKCSTAMAWDGSQDFRLYQHFAKNPSHFMSRYDGRNGRKLGDQGFIEDWLQHIGINIDTFPDLFGRYSVASYKVDKCIAGPPPGASVVAFHGKPKPNDIAHGWVAEAWQL